MSTQTALLIFARTASEESKHKSFKASKSFFEYQNKKTLQFVQKTGHDYFWIDEHQQIGSNFADRYLNAIQSVFDKGYEQVISIGNDSPSLEANHIQLAIEMLQHKDMCFGPSKDGGFYLWGVKKEHFKKENYFNLGWNTSTLLTNFYSLLQNQFISVGFIQKLGDLDVREDAFQLLQNEKLDFSLRLILLQITSEKKHLFSFYQSDLTSKTSNVYYNKGSPLAA
jgi:glycosyltransferase A (GT-A) superfamily protein (DUF2064 family)